MIHNLIPIKSHADNDDSLFEDYQSLYNTSLSLYLTCSKKAEKYSDLYEQEHTISDMLMEKLDECKTGSRNLTNSINYTNLARMKREKRNLWLNIIFDYKNMVSLLKGNSTAAIYDIYIAENSLNLYHEHLHYIDKIR